MATAFAAKDILGNVFSGLSMQFSKPFSKWFEDMCIVKKFFMKFFTGNQLRGYILMGHDFSKLNFKSSIVGNQLHINGNRLQLSKFKYQTLLRN